jgi:uncharacterized protein Usg
MNYNTPRQLSEGKHIVTVTEVLSDTILLQRRPVSYFDLKFENKEGFVNQRFYNNEHGRNIMDILLRRFGLDPEVPTFQNLLSAFNFLLHQKVSLTVITNERDIETMDWQPVQGEIISHRSIEVLLQHLFAEQRRY